MSQSLLKKMLNDKISCISLKKELMAELEKPIEKQDFDLINELNQCIIELTQQDTNLLTFNEKDIENKSTLIKRKNNINVISKKIKNLTAIVASIAILITASILFFSINNNMGGMVSSKIDKDPLSISEIILPITDNDPYGLKTVCYDNGMSNNVLTPDYIPSQFKLVKVSDIEDIHSQDENSIDESTTSDSSSDGIGFSNFFNTYNTDTISEECSNLTRFMYENESDNQVINISIEEYVSEMSAYLSILDNTDNIKTLDIKGKEATIYQNDQSGYNIQFCSDEMVYRLQTSNMEYDTVLKIAESFA